MDNKTVMEVFQSCLHNRRACKNNQKGCRYIDMSSKCAKHEWFHCLFTLHCRVCYKSLNHQNLSLHYDSCHEDITHSSGSTWSIKKTGTYQKSLVTTEGGTVVCFYRLSEQDFELVVFIPVMSKWLFEYRANLRLTNVEKNYSRLYNLQTQYCAMCDWYIKVRRSDFKNWSSDFDVCLNVILSK